MLSVQIVLFDGFDLLDALAPYEVFCVAEMITENALSVELVTAEGPRSVPSGTNGLKIEAGDRLDPERPGIILVPGASGPVEGDGPDSVPSILGRTVHTALPGMLGKALKQKDVVVATVCGGSLVLAMAGLLEGRPAVTNQLGMDLLGATGAVPIPARVVDDGNLVTGGGVTSGLDAALYLVERELGPRIAYEIEKLFEYERRGTVWRETGMAPLPLTGGEPQKAEKQAAIKEGAPTGKTQQEFAFDGDWDTTIATPVGKLQVRLSIVTYNGVVHGKAIQGNETVDFLDPVLQGDKLTWLLKIRKPMRLNLKFEVAVDCDHMTGVAKAGMLPASKLTGRRIP
ncbi:DJ-1/PfpI family protein [Paenibacillus sp. UNC499MF]|uniref:DJ-1/PfpI family protein n=1 Tax=Paenibacillus sp. UNC499MF TaxID=1502751 RepID=UPI00089FD900|nr:DJ-1/PfpI family protein [Paenibacillus sp. UNC499MF]SEG35847.1 Transcriptional regulator containing an amidase domain and an AraC-type DNA-binding HTH domain [Paenibacillus sp. UNC499MF]